MALENDRFGYSGPLGVFLPKLVNVGRIFVEQDRNCRDGYYSHKNGKTNNEEQIGGPLLVNGAYRSESFPKNMKGH